MNNSTPAPDASLRTEQHLARLPDPEFDDFVKGQLSALGKITEEFKRHALPYAINIGRALAVKKRKLQHGEYTEWVKSIGLNERTARMYKQLAARDLRDLRQQIGNVTDLSMRCVRATIAKPAKPSAVQLRARPRGLPSLAEARNKVPEVLMLLRDLRATMDPEEFYEQVLPDLRQLVAECDRQQLN